MSRAVELQAADGTPLAAFDFGTVLPGTSSAPKAITFKNTGTVGVVIKVWVENANAADGSLSVSFGGVALTAQAEADAPTVATLAPGASVFAEVSYVVPVESAGVMQAQSVLRFKYG